VLFSRCAIADALMQSCMVVEVEVGSQNFPIQLDLSPMFVPPVTLFRQAAKQGRQAGGSQAPAAGSELAPKTGPKAKVSIGTISASVIPIAG